MVIGSIRLLGGRWCVLALYRVGKTEAEQELRRALSGVQVRQMKVTEMTTAQNR